MWMANLRGQTREQLRDGVSVFEGKVASKFRFGILTADGSAESGECR
jgi:hypothetical protein